MPKEDKVLNPIIVEEWGRYVFRVSSESFPGRYYIVDLVANNGIGHCSCMDFSTKRQPLIDSGGKLGDERLFCKHIKVVRNYFLNRVLTHLAKEENQPANEKFDQADCIVPDRNPDYAGPEQSAYQIV